MTDNELANNIYDLLRGTILFNDPNKDNDWGKLTRKHYKEATKEVRKMLLNKDIEVSGNIIKIGKKFTIITNQ
jgi:hypothetical protein